MFECESCKKLHSGEYGSGRFCNIKCSRSFSTSQKRKEINQKVSSSLSGRKSEKNFKCELCGKLFGSKVSLGGHRSGCNEAESKILRDRKREQRIDEELSHPFEKIKPTYRKEKILREQLGRCNKCGLDKWLGEKITLELEHKDGNHSNNSRDNLELLCPNCHAMTDTWRGRNKGDERRRRVSDENLINALKATKTIRQALIMVGLSPRGGNYERAKRLRDSGVTVSASDFQWKLQEETPVEHSSNSGNS